MALIGLGRAWYPGMPNQASSTARLLPIKVSDRLYLKRPRSYQWFQSISAPYCFRSWPNSPELRFSIASFINTMFTRAIQSVFNDGRWCHPILATLIGGIRTTPFLYLRSIDFRNPSVQYPTYVVIFSKQKCFRSDPSSQRHTLSFSVSLLSGPAYWGSNVSRSRWLNLEEVIAPWTALPSPPLRRLS